MSRSLVAILVTVLILGLGAGAARLILPACGVNSPFPEWLLFCPAPSERPTPADLSALDDERRSLEQRIAQLQNQIEDLSCEDPAPSRDTIDRESWDQGDMRILEGCWQLDSEYRTVDQDTGVVQDYNDWQVCFARGSNGQGRQTMRATDGTVCEGDVSAAFNDANKLVITEPGNLQCSNNSYILRRIATCDYAENAVLQCKNVQPEVGVEGEYTMRPVQ